MKRTVLCVAALALCATALVSAQAGGNLVTRIALLKWNGTAYESLSFARTVEMNKGDTFQVAVETSSNSYCYVISEGTDGALTLLANTSLKPNKTLFLPEESSNFSVSSPAGTDMIHLIVSASKQSQLEKLFGKSAAGSEITQVMPVKDEILRLKQTLSTIAEAPEKPAAMGGVRRSLDEKNSFEFTGQKYYVKTISIRHQ